MAEVEVVLPGGVKIKMEEEHATTYHAARAKDKEEREKLASEVGKSRAEKDAAEAKATKAQEDKEAKDLAAKGELEALRTLYSKQSKEELAKFRDKYRDRALEAAIAKRADLLKFDDPVQQQRFIDDLVTQLRGSSQYDLDSDSLVISGRDGRPATDEKTGKPLGADAHIDSFVKDRPYLLHSKTSPGSGGSGSGRGPKTGVAQVTQADMAAGRVDAADVASGKVEVVD